MQCPEIHPSWSHHFHSHSLFFFVKFSIKGEWGEERWSSQGRRGEEKGEEGVQSSIIPLREMWGELRYHSHHTVWIFMKGLILWVVLGGHELHHAFFVVWSSWVAECGLISFSLPLSLSSLAFNLYAHVTIAQEYLLWCCTVHVFLYLFYKISK